MYNDASRLKNAVMLNDVVKVGEGTLASAKGIETLGVEIVADIALHYIVANDVAVVPYLATSRLSVSFLRRGGLHLSFTNNPYDVEKN